MPYSYSRLRTFENCPLCYRYRYIDRIKKEAEGIEAFMGQRVHEALEKLYKDLMYAKQNTLQDLWGFYEDRWNRHWNENVRIVKKEYSAQNYKDTGKRCIEQYYTRYEPFDQDITIATERRLTISIGGYTLIGMVDRAANEGGELVIHDYKTSGWLPSREEVERDAQLTLYALGAQNEWKLGAPVRMVRHYLAKDVDMRSEVDAGKIEEAKRWAIGSIERIESAEGFEPHESALCDWCDYQDLCPRRKHLFAVTTLSPNEYLKDDGVKLVNQYMHFSREAKRIQDEIDLVKEALIAYAHRAGVETVAGSDYKIGVRSYPDVLMPPWDSPERGSLEALLRDSGRWNEVSTLSGWRLKKSLFGGGWDPALVKEVEKIAPRTTRYKILRPSKIRRWGF